MNNCYSSLGSINGNPKKQNCGDGRCDPPDRGINPNPRHRELLSQIYRSPPSNDPTFGSIAKEAVLEWSTIQNGPSLRIPELNQEQLAQIGGGYFGFGTPGISLTATGGAAPTDARIKYYVDDWKAWKATGLGLNGNDVPILNSSEALALMGPTRAGGLIASYNALNIRRLLRLPDITIWENGGLAFNLSTVDNVHGGFRLKLGGTLAKIKYNSQSLSVYQERGGEVYYGEEFEIEEYWVGTPIIRFDQTSRSKMVIIPRVIADYTYLINGRHAIVLTAGAEAFMYRGLATTTFDASIEYKIWSSCARREAGKEANLSFGLFFSHTREAFGNGFSLTGGGGRSSGGGGGGGGGGICGTESCAPPGTPPGTDFIPYDGGGGGSLAPYGFTPKAFGKNSTAVSFQLIWIL